MTYHILDITQSNKGILVDTIENENYMIHWIINNSHTPINNTNISYRDINKTTNKIISEYQITKDNDIYCIYKYKSFQQIGWVWNSNNIEKTLIKKWSLLFIDDDVNINNVNNNNHCNCITIDFDKDSINDIYDYSLIKKLYNVPNLNILSFFDNVENIYFKYNFNEELIENYFNSSIKLIKFSIYFDKLINKNNLPENLKTLIFGDNFNSSINYLPNTLSTIIYGDSFNQSIDDLPNSIQFIKFGCNFDQPIKKLPNNLKKLIFGTNFNKFISKDLLPKTLKHLHFGHYFNQDMDDRLPPNLEILEFGYSYSRYIKKYPSLLLKLKLGDLYNYSLANHSLPETLEILEFGLYYQQIIGPYEIPHSIKQIIFLGKYEQQINWSYIPNSIKKITFKYNYPFDIPKKLI